MSGCTVDSFRVETSDATHLVGAEAVTTTTVYLINCVTGARETVFSGDYDVGHQVAEELYQQLTTGPNDS